MPSRQDFPSDSMRLRQQLEAAQTRIAELEAQLLDERKRAEAGEVVKHYTHRLQILRQIDLGIINANSTQEIITTALKHIRELIPCQRANVSLIDSLNQELVIFVVDSQKETDLGQGVRVPMQANFFDGVDNRKLRVIEDMRLLPASIPRLKQGLDEGLLSALNVILMDRDKPIGTFWLFSDKVGYFTTEHQEIALEIGNQIAIAIRQRQLSDELARHTAELEQRVAERTIELQTDKARIEALLNNSPNGILLINTDLSIQQWNTSLYTMLGCEPDHCNNVSLLDFIHEQNRDEVANLVKQVIEDHAGRRTEVQVLHQNGTTFDAELAVELIEGDGLVCTIQDITERKAHERQLRYHASIQTSVSDAVIATDMDLRIQSWNPAAEKIYGWTAEEVIGKFASKILKTVYLSEEDRQRVYQGFLEQGGWQREVIQHSKDGRTLHILASTNLFKDEKGQPIGIVSVNRDITERKQAAEALQKSAAEIHDLYNNAPCGYHSLDKNGVIIQINDTELSWLGYSRDEVVGKLKITEICTPESLLIYQRLRPALIKQGWFNDVEVELVRKDGSIIQILLNATAVYDDDGQLLQSRATLFDVTEIRKAQLEIRQREAHYRTLANNLPLTTVFLFDSNLRYLVVEGPDAAFPPEFMEGKTVQEVFAPEVLPYILPGYEAALRGHAMTLELPSNGRLYEGKFAPVFNADGIAPNGLLVVRDVTEERSAADVLRASEGRYRLLAENIDDIIMTFSMDRIITYMSPSCERLLGFSPEEVEGKSHSEFIHSDDYPQVIEKTRQAVVSKASSYTNQFRLRHKDNQYNWYEVRTRVIHDDTSNGVRFISVLRNISERKRAEDALRESEEKYRSLVETMHDGLAILDDESHITYVNDRFCEMFGYPREEMIGRYPTSFLGSDKMPLIQSHLERRQQGEATSYEVSVPHKDGRLVNVLFSGTPLFDKQGKHTGSFVITTDITVQKLAQDTLQQALAKEKELGELKTRFVSMASHEFRTPLATLLATVETLVAYRRKLSEDQIDQRLEKMKEQIAHLKNIMDDVLLLSRMQARRFDFNPIKINLDVLTRSVLDEFQNRPDIKHQVEYTDGGSLHDVVLDPKLMRQIINNLVSNAIKYSPAGKVVRVNLDRMDSVITLMVSDEGIGIPEADLPHLFEPFHRAINVENISGTGLGLVITKEAVELHGGAIGVESKVGVGTTFIVRIPISIPE